MYAVVKIGGHQYRVAEGDVLFVDRQHEEPGNSMTFDQVLMVNDTEGKINIGAPYLEGAAVKAELLDQVKADKIIVFKKKRRKGYKKKNGHRQPLSQIRIDSILAISAKGEKEDKQEKKAKSSHKAKPSPKVQKADVEPPQQVSTDMTAKEAIDHIKNTPLDKMKGFITDSEERVTVLKAWQGKQED